LIKNNRATYPEILLLFYSHLITSSIIKNKIEISDFNAYYFGTVFPDIRYLLKLPRHYTHLPSDEVLDYITEFEKDKNFLIGYYLHCVLDELDLPALISGKIPAKLLQGILSHKVKTVLLEYYFRDNYPSDIEILPVANGITEELNISRESLVNYVDLLNQYLKTDSLHQVVNTLENLGISRFGSVEKYLSAAEFVEKHEHIRHLLFSVLEIKTLESEITTFLEHKGVFKKLADTGIIKLKT